MSGARGKDQQMMPYPRPQSKPTPPGAAELAALGLPDVGESDDEADDFLSALNALGNATVLDGVRVEDARAEGPPPKKWALLRQEFLKRKSAQTKMDSLLGELLHDEKEGASAMLFMTLPKWIQYRRIPRCRYRRITAIQDPGDEAAWLRSGIHFFGFPGSSGWAQNIGSVAVHYWHHGKWAIFSKNFPFRDQDPSEDALLLLGSSNDVFLTPSTVYMAPQGLTDPAARVKLINSEGITLSSRVGAIKPYERLRLYLTWGNSEEAHSKQVQHLKPTERELKKTMGLVMRVMRKLSANINSRVKVRCAVASLAARQRGSCPLATRVPTGQRAPQPIP